MVFINTALKLLMWVLVFRESTTLLFDKTPGNGVSSAGDLSQEKSFVFMLENIKISTAKPQPGTSPQAPRDVPQPQLSLEVFLNELLDWQQ